MAKAKNNEETVSGTPQGRDETEAERLRRENGAQDVVLHADETWDEKRGRWEKFQTPTESGVNAEPAVAPNTEPAPVEAPTQE